MMNSEPEQNTTEWITLRDAVGLYPVSKRIFQVWIRSGQLPTYRPFSGKKILLKRTDIDSLIAGARE